MSTIKEEIIKNERALQTFKNNLAFAERTNSSVRKSKYQNLINETKARIKALKIGNPTEVNTNLQEKIDNLNQDIDTLQEAKNIVDKEINEKTEKLNKALSPLKPQIEPQIEAKVEPQIEESEVEMLECEACGRMVKGDKGMASHLSRWCKGEVKKHE